MALRARSRKRLTGLMGPSIAAVIPSAVCHLESTLSASYPGTGQTWANIVAAPADGAARTAYDFYLGASSSPTTDDPTFTGSAGASSAYFAFDGGDYFTIASGANTTFLNALHKTTGGTAWWCAAAYRPLNIAASEFLWSTTTPAPGRGMGMFQAATEAVSLQQRGDSASVNPSPIPGAVTPGTDTLVIFSCDTSGNVRRWSNSTTKSSHTWTLNTASADASQAMVIGGRSTASGLLSNGTRLYALAMGNAYLDDADAAKIFTYFNTRHGRTYA